MKRFITVALALVGWGIPLAAGAAGFAVSEQSMVAAGTGGAGTARREDPAAAWYNPAALVGLPGWHLSAGVVAATPHLDATAGDGSWSSSTRPSLSTPPHVYATWSLPRWAAGVAVNVPFGSGVQWPAAWPGRFEVTSTSLQVVRVSPFVAVRLGDLALAGGPFGDYARLQTGRDLDFIDTTGTVDLDLGGFSGGFHAAAFYQLSEPLALGLTYKSRSRVDLSGTALFDAPEEVQGTAHNQKATSQLQLPDRISLGIAYEPAPRWHVVADVGVTTWSVYDELAVDLGDDGTTDVRNVAAWRTRPWLRAGAQYDVSPRVALRGGALYDPSPAPAQTLSPTAPDADRAGATLGASWAFKDDWHLDGFYEILALRERSASNPASLDATYSGHVHFFGVGVRYRR